MRTRLPLATSTRLVGGVTFRFATVTTTSLSTAAAATEDAAAALGDGASVPATVSVLVDTAGGGVSGAGASQPAVSNAHRQAATAVVRAAGTKQAPEAAGSLGR